MKKLLLLTLSSLLSLGVLSEVSFNLPKALANSSPIVISKKITVSLKIPLVNASGTTATVQTTDDVATVVLTVTNTTAIAQQVDIKDVYYDSTVGVGFNQKPFVMSPKWCTQADFISSSTGCASQGNLSVNNDGTVTTTSSRSITASATMYVVYQVKGGVLPTYKTRLVAFPVSAKIGNVDNIVFDVSYVVFVPDNNGINLIKTAVVDSSSSDLGLLVPGATVTLANGTATSNSSLLYVPKAQLGANTSTDKTCSGSGNRGGACLLTSQASVSTGTGTSYASALLLVLPSSSIIGNFYDASNPTNSLLLPGQHTSNVAGTTAASNVIYNIDQKSVSGWDPNNSGQIYRNVYMNANVNRLVASPDWILDKNNYTTYNGSDYSSITCSGCSGGGTPTFTLQFKNGNNRTLDLSSSNLNAGSFNSNQLSNCTATDQSKCKPTNVRKDGYVLLVKGNLIIDGSQVGFPVSNMAKGTIIAQGSVTINDLTIKSIGSTDENNQNAYGYAGSGNGPLGIMALGDGTGGSGLVTWENTAGMPANEATQMLGVSVFAKDQIKAITAAKNQKLVVVGSLVSQVVDLSKVIVNPDPDIVNIQVRFDSNFVTNPPPGFAVFANPVQGEIP